MKLRFGMRPHTFKSITQKQKQLPWNYPQVSGGNVHSSGPYYERKERSPCENGGLPPSSGLW